MITPRMPMVTCLEALPFEVKSIERLCFFSKLVDPVVGKADFFVKRITKAVGWERSSVPSIF